MTRTRVAHVVSLACAHHIPCIIYMRSCCVFDSLRLPPLSSLCCLSSLLSSCLSSWPSTSSSTMWWTKSLCTSANEDLGTLAEYDPLTSYEPNDLHISEATEPYNQESSCENGSLNDLGHCALFTAVHPAARRCSEPHDEGLSSSQSSSVGHRAEQPFWNGFHSLITNVRENPRGNSENEQIRILQERQREQILGECQAEIQKRVPGRLWQKRSFSKVEWNYRVSKRRNWSCSSLRRTTSTRSTVSPWTIIGTKLGSSWSSWKKFLLDGRIDAISRLNIRHYCEEKIGRRSRHHPWTHK